jgi:hypothetical protein
MRTKEEYYQSVLKNRMIADDPENQKCSCPKTRCEWHGKCRDCVTIHRFHNDHIPYCFQSLLKDKIISLAKIVELETTGKEITPSEYRDYVMEQDARIKSIQEKK